jgi:hypothetical protein
VSFNVVWGVVQEEVHRRYVGIHREDAVAGVIETDYKPVENLNQDLPMTTPVSNGLYSTGGMNGPIRGNLPGGTSSSNNGDTQIFRMTVQVLGPPWKVSIEGVAAKVSPGMTLPVPYRRGAADEPAWVQARIDNLSLAIYERLKKFAVKGAKIAVEEKKADTTIWANLSDPTAVAVIESVRKVAGQHNAAALRPFMSDDFRWDEGADASADTAVAVWAADPNILQLLTRTLDAGCATAEGTKDITCPKEPTPDTGHARFRHLGTAWKLIEFLK